MLIRKQLLQQVKDQEVIDYNPSHRISQTLQYKNSESIQEEEEHSSLSQICYLKPVFLQTCPQQPIDIQSSEDNKVPTITNINSHKSTDQLHQKSESKKLVLIHNDSSFISSSSLFQSQLLSDYNKKFSIDQGRVKIIVNQIKQKLLNSIHYSKYNDPLVTQEQDDVSSLRYYYFTMYVFLSVIISNLLTIIFIPINIIFDGPKIINQVVFGIKLWTLIQDVYFQRGPYKLLRGKLITNFKSWNKIYLDSFRTISTVAIVFFKFDNEMTLMILILLLIISDLIRTLEPFENIYRSTHYIIFIVQLWISIVVMCTCFLKSIFISLLRVFNEEEYSLRFYITYSISLITQNSNISMEITEQNSFIVSFFMLISYLCYAYTFILLCVWIKPGIEIQEEKQKLLKGFVELFQEKCRDQDLLRRCYSYLDFRIDEDLGRSKDQLTKKLSPALQDEIEISLRTRMIDKIELMNKFSPQFKQQLLYAIEQVTFNPEDNIIIEHQIEDLGLYYILKGEVKVQFQGSSLANNKRSVTRLKEGQAFGQYSFISGVPSNISIYSCGVTTLMKLKRSEFMDIISNFPKDNEIFCMMKDNSCYNQHLFDCYYCKIKGHYILECNHIQYFPQRQNVIEKYLYSIKQVRQTYTRKNKKYLTFKNLSQNQDKAKQVITKQDIMSEDLPEASQLPYSENQTYSVSYVSNSMPFQKASQDQQVSNSNVNADSLEQLNYEQEQQQQQEEPAPPILDSSIKPRRQNSNKTSHRTAGFVGNPQSQNYSTLDKDEKEILFQLQEGQKNELVNQKQLYLSTTNRSSPNKLTFQFQKEIASLTAKQEIIKQDFIQQQFSYGNLKQSLRQPTNRSHTYTNSYSKDISNYPSSNSRQNKSLRLSSQTKDNGKKTNSANTQSDENKNKQRSYRTGTKQSNLAQQSQFQAITSPENQGYFINDVIFNKFEKMKSYQIYYPHNNYDQVIIRQQSFQINARSKHKKPLFSPYSIKCYVISKIRRVQRIIKK